MIKLHINEHTGVPFINCKYETDGSLEANAFKLLYNHLSSGKRMGLYGEGGSITHASFSIIPIADQKADKEESDKQDCYTKEDLISLIEFVNDSSLIGDESPLQLISLWESQKNN